MISLRAMSVTTPAGQSRPLADAQTKLTHALGYNVDKQLRVRNDLAGFLQELSRHNAQGVMARVGSAGNWRIVGEQDESGRAEKREPSIATKKGTVNVRRARFLVNQFSRSRGR